MFYTTFCEVILIYIHCFQLKWQVDNMTWESSNLCLYKIYNKKELIKPISTSLFKSLVPFR